MAQDSVRQKELYDLINNDPVLIRAVDEMIMLEELLTKLKKLPFIKVHPTDPTKQKATPAAKLYKESLQQYTNLVRIMMKATGADEHEEDSPLRKWFRENLEE